MHISRIHLKNWRNFRDSEAKSISEIAYILGPNAAGKSNLLDALRFLRDIAKSKGGGLQEAISQRGGIKKIRCLHARADTEVMIKIDVANEDGKPAWQYELAFNIPGSGSREPEIKREIVVRYDTNSPDGKQLLTRPDPRDDADRFLLRETSIEQASANGDFRDLASFLGAISYVHLVPQLLKFGDHIGGRVIDDDPFGQEFLLRVARTLSKTRNSRLKKIEVALRGIVPSLENLQFVNDEITGHPHLEIRFKHHRPHGAKQREDQFSDGTLRLISLLWLLQESGGSPLLLEEPELSLNEEIVAQLAEIFASVRNNARSKRQIFVTTHSEALLSNPGIDEGGLIIIEPSQDGSKLRKTSDSESKALSVGLSPAEVVLPRARRAGKSRQLLLDF